MNQKLENFTSNPSNCPENNASLTEIEAHYGCLLPTQYRFFMSERDGGEGFIGDQYLILWRASEIEPFNSEYETEKYIPGLLLFGSNGAGEAYAFDLRDNSMRIVMVPFIGMSLKDALPIADTFNSFLSNLANEKIF